MVGFKHRELAKRWGCIHDQASRVALREDGAGVVGYVVEYLQYLVITRPQGIHFYAAGLLGVLSVLKVLPILRGSCSVTEVINKVTIIMDTFN